MFISRNRLGSAMDLRELAVLPWDFQVPFGHQPAGSQADTGVLDGSPVDSKSTPRRQGLGLAAVDKQDMQLPADRYAQLYQLLSSETGAVKRLPIDDRRITKEEVRLVGDRTTCC